MLLQLLEQSQALISAKVLAPFLHPLKNIVNILYHYRIRFCTSYSICLFINMSLLQHSSVINYTIYQQHIYIYSCKYTNIITDVKINTWLFSCCLQIYRLEIETADLARRRLSTSTNSSQLNTTSYWYFPPTFKTYFRQRQTDKIISTSLCANGNVNHITGNKL